MTIPDAADREDDQERRDDPQPYGFSSDEIPFNGEPYGAEDVAAHDAELMTFDEWRTHWQLVGDELAAA